MTGLLGGALGGRVDGRPGGGLDLAWGEGRTALRRGARGLSGWALDWSAVGVEKGRAVAPDVDWQVGDALTAPLPTGLDLVVMAYFQVPAHERRTAVGRAVAALAPGGRFFVVAHDSTNLTEGTGGPQDPAVLYTAEDVLADLAGVGGLEVLRAERVPRAVPAPDGHGPAGTAWDSLVHLRVA